MDTSSLCRGCMTEVASWDIQMCDKKVADMYTFCTKIMILENEKLPKHFCHQCLLNIESSYTYIKKAQDVDTTLRNLIYKIETNVPSNPRSGDATFDVPLDSKIEIKVEPVNDDCDTNSNDSDSFLYDVKIKQESLLNSKSTHREIKEEITVSPISTQKSKNTIKKGRTVKKRTINPKSRRKPKTSEEDKKDNDNSDSGKETSELDPRNTCDICKKVFIQPKCLVNHIRKAHSSNKAVKSEVVEKTEESETETKHKDGKKEHKCPKCNKTFRSNTWYTRHMENAHLGVKRFVCRHCPKSFLTYSQHRHHEQKHPEHRKHLCADCGKRFKKRKELAAHYMLQHAKGQPCHICDMSFQEKSDLDSHIEEHKGQRPHLCEVCGSGFGLAVTLMVHMRSHTGEKPFACDLCPFRTGHKGLLTRHIYRHRLERRYQCPYCPKNFYEPGDRARHVRSHTGERPYKCPKCPKAFSNAWKRKVHLIRVHHLVREEIPTMDRDGQAVKGSRYFKPKKSLDKSLELHEGPHLCHTCGAEFNTADALKVHMRSHAGEKRFTCELCPFRATQRWMVTRHMLRHRQERRYRCPQCAKTFYESGDLNRHIRTHTGERPFKCPSCAQSFSHGWKRKKHLVAAHQLAPDDIPRMNRDGVLLPSHDEPIP